MNRIREFRKKKKISQAEVAKKMNLNQHTISQWETGERIPNVMKALKLAEILETPVESLYK